MLIKTSLAVRNARSSVFLSAMNDGSLVFYDGSIPAGGGEVTSQNLIGTIDLPAPCGEVADGVFSITPGLEGQVTTGGTITWVRILDSADAWVMDLDVGEGGSDAAVIVPVATLYEGAFVRINQFRLTEP